MSPDLQSRPNPGDERRSLPGLSVVVPVYRSEAILLQPRHRERAVRLAASRRYGRALHRETRPRALVVGPQVRFGRAASLIS